MPRPNLFLVYVKDARKAAEFYGDLFDMDPVFVSPCYVAFALSEQVSFAVWSGKNEDAVPETPRTSEVGLMVPGSGGDVDATCRQWSAKGVRIVKEPYDEVFGRTFVAADPDGNLIRVSPMD